MISDVRARDLFRFLRMEAVAAAAKGEINGNAIEKSALVEREIRAATRDKNERASLRAFYAEHAARERAVLVDVPLDEALVDEEPAA